MFFDNLPSVSPTQLSAKVVDGWMLLDVRTDDEWAGGRIEGSTHIPMDELMVRMDEVADRVVCICAVGGRSARVTQFLNAHGKEALNLDGGVQAWAAQGGPLES